MEAVRNEEEIWMTMKNTVAAAGEQHDRQERELGGAARQQAPGAFGTAKNCNFARSARRP